MTDFGPGLIDLVYRITGDRGDAEDIVQEAFTRALAAPPAGPPASWRPWLTRVAVNLARDRLRARRRRGYDGPWLPTPVDALPSPAPSPADAAERREAVGWAALVALEALTPQQRVVWVLREVAELDVAEVAAHLGCRPEAVRAAHARARRAWAAARPDEPHDLDAALAAAWARLAAALDAQDPEALRAALADDVVAITDAGGAAHAARRPVVGPDAVARLLLGLHRKAGPQRVTPVRVNDRLALRLAAEAPRAGFSADSLLIAELAADGRLRRLYTVQNPAKLGRVG